MSNKGVRIVVVEDDPLYADSLEQLLARAFPGAAIERVRTEHEFTTRIDDYRAAPPSVFVIDVMLRWTDPAPEMPEPPDEVKRQGFYKAGLRCQARLASQAETRDVPVVFHSVLERGDLGGILDDILHVTFVAKGSDGEELLRAVKASMHRD